MQRIFVSRETTICIDAIRTRPNLTAGTTRLGNRVITLEPILSGLVRGNQQVH